VGVAGVPAESQRLVEPRGRGIRRAEPEGGEPAAGGRDDGAHELPADTMPPMGRQHVQMPHAANARITGVWVDVQAADADQKAVQLGAEQGLTRAIEAIAPALPFRREPAHESQAGLLALGDQGRQPIGRQLMQPLDAPDRPRHSRIIRVPSGLAAARLGRTMREHTRHPHPDPLPLRGRGSRFDPLAPGGGEGQGEGVHRTRNTRS